MSFFEAIQACFSNYINFKGRAIRSEYNYWILFSFLIGAITGILDAIFFGLETLEYGFSPINSLASILLFMPSISVVVRRFHDINKSGWNYFWCFTIIGIIPVIYWLCFKEGDSEENFYGSNPMSYFGETSEDKKNDIDFDNISKLEKLAKLKEQGHLTEEEYNEKKKELL